MAYRSARRNVRAFWIFSNVGNQTSLGSERGMTLIEIMIVIAIIGSIMAIVGVNAKKAFDKSKVSNAKLQMGELSKSLDQYNIDCNSYPPNLEALLSKPGDGCANWGPQAYTKKKLLIDPWGHPFIYESQGGTYTLLSLGRDGKQGGDGLDADIPSEDPN